jgi:hypothetical protein
LMGHQNILKGHFKPNSLLIPIITVLIPGF